MHQYSVDESIKIQISDLTIGMFVTGIENSDRINLSNAGRVLNTASIEKLTKCKINFVWVDKKLSDDAVDFSALTQYQTIAPPIKLPSNVSRSNHYPPHIREEDAKSIIEARTLINETKHIANRIITKTFDPESFVVEEFDSWAEELINFTFKNHNAVRLVSALRSKDEYLLEHSISVSTLLVTFARYLGFTGEKLKAFAIGGLIHDIGKIKVDDAILNKPSKLTDIEFEKMKMHQTYAKDIIFNIKSIQSLSRDICLMHHEKLDGNGYPLGLKEEEIPIHGRMSSIVDIFDALTADRVYKKSMSPHEAFKILLKMAPHQLDRNLIYQFINCLGIYPVASIVEINNGHAAVVWKPNQKHQDMPLVKCFYSLTNKHFTDIEFKDLSQCDLSIVRAISPSELDFDINEFITK